MIKQLLFSVILLTETVSCKQFYGFSERVLGFPETKLCLWFLGNKKLWTNSSLMFSEDQGFHVIFLRKYYLGFGSWELFFLWCFSKREYLLMVSRLEFLRICLVGRLEPCVLNEDRAWQSLRCCCRRNEAGKITTWSFGKPYFFNVFVWSSFSFGMKRSDSLYFTFDFC